MLGHNTGLHSALVNNEVSKIAILIFTPTISERKLQLFISWLTLGGVYS